METLTDPGTVPLGVAESHDPPEFVEDEVVKLMPEVPEMLTDCATGGVVPIV